MTRRQLFGLWGGLALVLVVVNVGAVGKERLRLRGQRVLLPLAPVDPRSLMQGDYMRLRYALADDLRGDGPDDPDGDGLVVLRRDAEGVGTYARLATPNETLAPGELLLRYSRHDSKVTVGPDAFFFQEGQGDRYARAAFADLRVSHDGEAIFVGLRDRARQPL